MPKTKNTLHLSLTTISTSTKTPIYKITVDNAELVEPTSTTSIDTNKNQLLYTYTADKINKITVELLNKENNDTVVVDGNITEDLLLIIDSLCIDGIDLTNNLSKISVYKDTANQVHRTFNYITFNGTMTIKIHDNLLYTNWLSNFV